MERKKKRERRGERQIGGTDAAKKRCSICSSLEIEPFKIRYLKNPSFTRYSSYGHNTGEMVRGGKERRRQSDRDKEIESGREKTLKDSTSKRGSL